MLYSYASSFIEEARRLRRKVAELVEKKYPKAEASPRSNEQFNEILNDQADIERLIQRACLELRLACEKAAYEVFEKRRQYYNQSFFDAWQPDQIIAFASDELDENLAYDSSTRFRPSESKAGPEAWSHLGDKKGIDKNTIKKLYQSLGGFLHIQRGDTGFPNFVRLKNRNKTIEKIDEAIEFFDSFRGKIDSFWVVGCVEIICDCGEKLKRPYSKLQFENFVECPTCFREWRILGQDETGRWAKEPAAMGCACPSCSTFIPIPRVLSLGMVRTAFKSRSTFHPPETLDRILVCQNPECSGAIALKLEWSVTKEA